MKALRQLSVSLAWLAAMFLSLSAIAHPASEGKVTYFINDLLGSPVVAMEQSGAVIWRESFSGYGERKNQPADAAQSARAANKVWYTSRHQDEDTGLVYMGARYYDPALGRFMSVDPVHFVETNSHSFNRYAYANNNPYKYVDPDGNLPVLVIPALIWAGKALSVASVGITAYETTTVVRNVAVGDMTAGDAVRQELPGIAVGAAFGVAGKVISKTVGSMKALDDWKNVSKEQKNLIQDFFGKKGHEGMDKLEKDFKVPEVLTKDTLQKYEGVAKRQIERGADTNGVQQRRVEIIHRTLE